jgi:hypothetical protein
MPGTDALQRAEQSLLRRRRARLRTRLPQLNVYEVTERFEHLHTVSEASSGASTKDWASQRAIRTWAITVLSSRGAASASTPGQRVVCTGAAAGCRRAGRQARSVSIKVVEDMK